MMSQEQVTLERKIIKHRNRNAAYHFQLPAFEEMVRRANAVPILDSNIVNLLEALTDLLAKIGEFDGYRPPNMDELDLSGSDVSFSFGCNYCDKKDFNVMQALDHEMIDVHPQQSDKKAKKLQRFREGGSAHYQNFLLRKHELMIKNRLIRSSLDRMLDFYLVTKSFIKMTSRYLSSLEILEMVPSSIVARGVFNLLKQIDSLLSRAKCIESIPEFNSMMGYLFNFDVKFVSNGRAFDEVHSAINHAASSFGLKPNLVPSVERNIFSFPPPSITNTELHHNTPVGSLITIRPPMTSGPNGLPNIVPFTTCPPIRMMPPTMPVTRPPMIPVPLVPVNMNMIEQQQFQQMMMNPTFGIAQHTRTLIFQQQQQQQQQMVFKTPPPQPNHVGVGCGSGNPNQPTPLNSAQHLPPLSQSGTKEHPLLSVDLKRFLEDPQLDSLIENGNYLIQFSQSSVVPGEIVQALKAVAPDVKVECFGAKVSGVGYEEDFINLYVDDGNKTKTDASVKLLFSQLMSFFTANVDEWVVQNTEEAGVRTHLTVKNICEGLCCRISFASEIYCSNSKLIRYYMNTFPMCQKLCYFVQEFVKLIDLDFNRYVILVLVIFYLQRRDYLPTVAQLQTNLPKEELCGHWLINFEPKNLDELKLKDCQNDLRKSAIDFFLFYGKQFSFRDSVVCPHAGMVVSRSDFFPENDWRMPVKRYRAYLEAQQAVEGVDAKTIDRFVTTPMCVQDLLELKTNISRGVHCADTEKFSQMCKMAHEYYSNNQ